MVRSFACPATRPLRLTKSLATCQQRLTSALNKPTTSSYPRVRISPLWRLSWTCGFRPLSTCLFEMKRAHWDLWSCRLRPFFCLIRSTTSCNNYKKISVLPSVCPSKVAWITSCEWTPLSPGSLTGQWGAECPQPRSPGGGYQKKHCVVFACPFAAVCCWWRSWGQGSSIRCWSRLVDKVFNHQQKGAFTDWHFDLSGSTTFMTLLVGQKEWSLIPPMYLSLLKDDKIDLSMVPDRHIFKHNKANSFVASFCPYSRRLCWIRWFGFTALRLGLRTKCRLLPFLCSFSLFLFPQLNSTLLYLF